VQSIATTYISLSGVDEAESQILVIELLVFPAMTLNRLKQISDRNSIT
jgi:hypothetical protein